MIIPYNFTDSYGGEVDGVVNLDEVKATRHTKDVDGESWEIVFGETQTIEIDKDTFDAVQQELLATNPKVVGK